MTPPSPEARGIQKEDLEPLHSSTQMLSTTSSLQSLRFLCIPAHIATVSSLMDHLNTPEAKGKGKSGQGPNTPQRSRTTTPNPPVPQNRSTTEHYPDHGNHNTPAHSYPSLHTSGAAMLSQQLGQYYLYLANTESTPRQSSQPNQRNQANQGDQWSQANQNTQGR